MTTQNDWPLLSELQIAPDALVATQEIIGRGEIPARGIRDDIPGSATAEPIDALLAKATRADVWLSHDEITVHFECGEQEVRAILGPRSDLSEAFGGNRLGRAPVVGLAWSYSVLSPRWEIKLRNVRAHQPSLDDALAAAGHPVKYRRSGHQADEENNKDGQAAEPLPQATDRKRRKTYESKLDIWLADQDLRVLLRTLNQSGPIAIAEEFRAHCEREHPDLLPSFPKRLRRESGMPRMIEQKINSRAEASRNKNKNQQEPLATSKSH